MEQFSLLKDLVPDVLLGAPECPDNVAYHALCHGLADFLKASRIWQEVVSGALPSGSRECSLQGLPSALVEEILSLSLDGSVVPRTCFRVRSDGIVIFDAVADKDCAVEAVCVLVSDVHASHCPSWIVRENSAALIARARYELLRTPGVPYSNPDAAVMYLRDYEFYLSEALGRSSTGRRGYSRGFAS